MSNSTPANWAIKNSFSLLSRFWHFKSLHMNDRGKNGVRSETKSSWVALVSCFSCRTTPVWALFIVRLISESIRLFCDDARVDPPPGDLSLLEWSSHTSVLRKILSRIKIWSQKFKAFLISVTFRLETYVGDIFGMLMANFNSERNLSPTLRSCHQLTSSSTSVTNKKALYTHIELYISEIRYNIYNLIKLLDQNKPQLWVNSKLDLNWLLSFETRGF